MKSILMKIIVLFACTFFYSFENFQSNKSNSLEHIFTLGKKIYTDNSQGIEKYKIKKLEKCKDFDFVKLYPVKTSLEPSKYLFDGKLLVFLQHSVGKDSVGILKL